MEVTNPHIKKRIRTKTHVFREENLFPTQGKRYLNYLRINVNSGKKLILCSISIAIGSDGNVGFIVEDKNGPVIPLRAKSGARNPVHFTAQHDVNSQENQNVVTFHMVADVEEFVIIAIQNDDSGNIGINGIPYVLGDKPYDHKTISTLTVISL